MLRQPLQKATRGRRKHSPGSSVPAEPEDQVIALKRSSAIRRSCAWSTIGPDLRQVRQLPRLVHRFTRDLLRFRHVVAVRVELLALRGGVLDAEEGRRVGAGSRDPLLPGHAGRPLWIEHAVDQRKRRHPVNRQGLGSRQCSHLGGVCIAS